MAFYNAKSHVLQRKRPSFTSHLSMFDTAKNRF